MPSLFSKTGQYGIQAVLYLARETDGKTVLQREIIKAIDVPPHFIGKILQNLVKAGILASQKGKNGGFTLRKPAHELTLIEVVQALEGPEILQGCVLGFPSCGDEAPCPLHNEWKGIKHHLLEILQTKTVSSLGVMLDGKLTYIATEKSLREKMEQILKEAREKRPE